MSTLTLTFKHILQENVIEYHQAKDNYPHQSVNNADFYFRCVLSPPPGTLVRGDPVMYAVRQVIFFLGVEEFQRAYSALHPSLQLKDYFFAYACGCNNLPVALFLHGLGVNINGDRSNGSVPMDWLISSLHYSVSWGQEQFQKHYDVFRFLLSFPDLDVSDLNIQWRQVYPPDILFAFDTKKSMPLASNVSNAEAPLGAEDADEGADEVEGADDSEGADEEGAEDDDSEGADEDEDDSEGAEDDEDEDDEEEDDDEDDFEGEEEDVVDLTMIYNKDENVIDYHPKDLLQLNSYFRHNVDVYIHCVFSPPPGCLVRGDAIYDAFKKIIVHRGVEEVQRALAVMHPSERDALDYYFAFACEICNLPVAQYLLTLGVGVNYTEGHDENMISWMFSRRSYYINHPGRDEFLQRHYGVWRLLLSVPAFNPFVPTGDGDAWERLLSDRYPNDIIEACLAKGGDPNVMVYDEESRPLGIAARRNNLPLVEMLLRYGANPNMRDMDGRLPRECTQNEAILGVLSASEPFMQLLYCLDQVGIHIDADSAMDLVAHYPEYFDNEGDE